jgi:AraC family transcriptional regulator
MGQRQRRWTSPDLCVDLSAYSAGCALGTHRHKDAFFCFVLSGAYEERARGLRAVLRPGSLVYHAAGCEHANTWHEQGRCLHVEFGPSLFQGANHAALSGPVPQIVAGPAGSVVQRMYEELRHVDSASEIAFEGLALMLLAETIREASREPGVPRWLQRVRDRLLDEYISPPTLRQIALDAGVHPTYVAASFQKHFGVSVGEFVRSRRIERARTLLTHSETPLSEVALLLGFSDQSHFGRTFLRQVGLTPREYRRRFATEFVPVPEP